MKSVISYGSVLLVLAGAPLFGCGPSPATPPASSGTLVVVVRRGPELVPFDPKAARIQRANQQLADVLGHSIRIELDGSLLPDTKGGADDLITSLLEDVVQDLAELAKHDKAALGFAREHVERIVVRYAPVEAAAREDRRAGRTASTGATLDVPSKTIDVVRGEARSRALFRGEIGSVLARASAARDEGRYARVLPDALPSRERRAWFEHHAHGSRTAKDDEAVGSVHPLRVRGMVMLDALAKSDGDGALSDDVRKWLFGAMSSFSDTYHHHAAEVEAGPPAFRSAETTYVEWLRAELPRMTLDERERVASHLWVIDFRKSGRGERDRFATYAFPGFDPMAFSFHAVDGWIASGHPTASGRSSALHPFFEYVVCPATADTKNGALRWSTAGRCEGQFYAWALVDRGREDALVKGVMARNDTAFSATAFYHARRALAGEGEYLRFLRRFEGAPTHWKLGADVLREVVYRPSPAVLEESRRYWREVPAARPYALLWFARHVEVSYHPDTDWPDLVQGALADEDTLAAFVGLGWDAFKLVPVAWPAVAKGRGRMKVIATGARALLDADPSTAPSQGVTKPLSDLAHVLCEEGSLAELAELRAFASRELASRPGAGLSQVVEAAEPASCKPRRPVQRAAPQAGPPRRTSTHVQDER